MVSNKICPEVIIFFFILSATEHELLNAYRYKISRHSPVSGLDKLRKLFLPFINVKMPIIIGILTFMSRENFMIS